MVMLKACLMFITLSVCQAWGSGGSDRVLLKDVSVITLYNGRMTTGKRSSPVPQLNCIGGTAGKNFIPQVVQCYNRGSDGYDVQWECKSDMDNEYRFGQIEVTCEGYDYPEDPYIVKGSCGLEFTLDYTKEGHEKSHGGHQYYGGQQQYPSHNKHQSGGMGTLVFLFGAGVVIYIIYHTCLASSPNTTSANASTGPARSSDAPPPYPGTSRPPPPGFRDEYTTGGNTYSSSYGSPGCGSNSYTTPPPTHGSSGTGGGFWTGVGTGGLMGYLFGSRNSRQGYYQQPNQGWGSGWGGSGWGGSGWGTTRGARSYGGSSPRPSGAGSGSTGTRTASGFGGTKRR